MAMCASSPRTKTESEKGATMQQEQSESDPFDYVSAVERMGAYDASECACDATTLSMPVPEFSRRTFCVGALAALGTACAVAGGTGIFGLRQEEAFAATSQNADEEQVVWSQCNVNCGGRCVFRYHVKDGVITYVKTDDTGDPSGVQARACLRGRSIRRWINSPDRLQYPMKRAAGAQRGEGKFERISWDEAIKTIADTMGGIIAKYGNDAVYINYGSGMYSATGRTTSRLMNVLGGCLGYYGDYSTACMQKVMPYMYGEDCTPYDDIYASSMTEAAKSDLIIMFGNSPAETRMGGANIVYDFARVREAVLARGGQIISIDYRLNETSAGYPQEWLPIRTGTDAALVSALAHELIADDEVDHDFLNTYCVGYDDATMPASLKGQNKSYYDYIMGTGYDKVEKTPEWAAPITQIPADTIRKLARKIERSRALFVVQGWGPQRHSNGEHTTRAICMLPVLTGQIGKPGTNTGMREAEPSALVGTVPSKTNAVKAKISNYQWVNAIDHGTEMTALNAGVEGVDKLANSIKMVWSYAGNCLTNQHGDINHTHDILVDESKCEFIVVTDTLLTDSAKYADILLPDAMRAEQLNMSTNGYAEWYLGVCVGGPAQDLPFECRPAFDVNADIADRFGQKEAFTEGLTQDEWVKKLYEAGAAKDGNMPTWEGILEQGLYKRELEPVVGLVDFVSDPVANPLATPSGKIEIYSEQLANIAATWELEPGDVISPIPVFDPGLEGYGETTDEYPLHCSGFHYKSRTHSSFGSLDVLAEANRQHMWISTSDADARGIKNGDICSVTSPRGELLIEAKVTSRIIPGTVGIPQGSWHVADMSGDRIDHGGCINTLTMQHPTPLAKGNPHHSNIVQVAKATGSVTGVGDMQSISSQAVSA